MATLNGQNISVTYNGQSKDLRYINIDAAPGQPSTFWVSNSGRYYRTYAEAKADNPATAVNPQDYVLKKSFYQQHKRIIWACVVLLAAGLSVVYLFDKNKLVLNGKPW